MLESEGKPPATVMTAQIIHDTAIARMICVKKTKQNKTKNTGNELLYIFRE